jgi:hypothetical protein
MQHIKYIFCLLGLFFLSLQARADNKQQVISGAILLKQKSTPDFASLVQSLKSTWKIKPDSVNISDKTLVFNTPDATIMVAYLDYAVPEADLRAIATFNWQWKTAAQEAVLHRAQLVVSVVGNSAKSLVLQQQFTKVSGAILEKNPCIAVYIESQYLLLSRDFYFNAAQSMVKEETLPLNCWVYFGLMGEQSGNNGYSFGLSEFGLPEIEVVNSKKSLTEVHTAMYDVAHTLVKYQSLPPQGEGKFTTLEGYDVLMKKSKAKFLEGETLKLEL